MSNKKKKKIVPSRPEKEIILEYISLGRGNSKRKTELASEMGLSSSTMNYRVKNFKEGFGAGRKVRKDKGIPKKNPEIKTKLEFFAELAMGTSVDEATRKLNLTEHQGNVLAKEFKQQDRWKAIRNAPQLDQLKDLIQTIFRIDIALVDAEMHGSFSVEVEGNAISIPTEELNDIKAILAHCLQRDKMGEIDQSYRKFTKTDLMNARVYYLKEELLEKKNVTEFARLHKAVKPSSPEKQLDLKLVYAIIDRYSPGTDEPTKIKVIKEEFEKLKID